MHSNGQELDWLVTHNCAHKSDTWKGKWVELGAASGSWAFEAIEECLLEGT